MEGFEHRQTSAYHSRLYTSFAGALNTGAGRKHGNAGSGSNVQLLTRALVGSVQNTWIFQFAVLKTDESAITNTAVFALYNSVGEQLAVHLLAAPSPDAAAYKIEIRRGATVLATANRLFRPGTNGKGWWVFQLKATVRTGTNGVVELRAWDHLGAQSTVIASTGSLNTANQGTDGADRVFFGPQGTLSIFRIDDIVVMDSTGSVNNDLTSTPIIVYGERANADVAGELDWIPSTGTNHSVLVDDDPLTGSGDVDEVTSEVVGDVDLYGHSQTQLDLAPTGAPPTVLGIQVDMEGLMKTSGTRTVRARFKDSSNQADDTVDMVYNDTAKASRFTVLEQNPTGTPAAWTLAVLKTIEFGPKLTA
jgi:hypothetical protein